MSIQTNIDALHSDLDTVKDSLLQETIRSRGKGGSGAIKLDTKLKVSK